MSSPAIPRKITVTFSPEAKAEWACLPEHVKRHLLATIQDKAPHSHELMPLVIGWTCDGNNQHLYQGFQVLYGATGLAHDLFSQEVERDRYR
jgi:hypothetical protein